MGSCTYITYIPGAPGNCLAFATRSPSWTTTTSPSAQAPPEPLQCLAARLRMRDCQFKGRIKKRWVDCLHGELNGPCKAHAPRSGSPHSPPIPQGPHLHIRKGKVLRKHARSLRIFPVNNSVPWTHDSPLPLHAQNAVAVFEKASMGLLARCSAAAEEPEKPCSVRSQSPASGPGAKHAGQSRLLGARTVGPSCR